ncbi:hypothetical protein ACM66B_003217 [Microbotryomycetes sp. NB124-2]
MAQDVATRVLVRALHSFDAPVSVNGDKRGEKSFSGACLSFKRGQLVTVSHKDSSGWWHGQLESEDGRSGWFPSNYVEQIDDNETSHVPRTRSVSVDSPRHSLEPSTSSQVALPSLPPAHPVQAIKDSITNAVTLLSNAVSAQRVSHYQPSTACVISAVRTLLSATSCLTRESTTLRSHPSLAASRKRILAALASLVNQARKASSSVGTSAHDAHDMLALANNVESCAQEFLTLVEDLRVPVQHPLTIGSDATTYDRKGSIETIEMGAGTALRHAKSTPDLRPTSTANPPPPPLPPKGQRMSVPVFSSIRSNHVLATTHDLSVLTTTIHDALLSTIAAFIGHVHAHSRSSHASSFAQLIDLTRETIERVRDVLVVVEAVTNCDALGSDIGALESSRERLYISTTSLVTAARVATSTPRTPSEAPTPNPETLLASPNTDDAEKSQLLASAMGVLRAGGDCISLVKASLNQTPSNTQLGLVLKPSDAAPSSNSSSPALPAPVQRRVEGSPSLQARRQNPHTLSMLGRKASSLVPLRDLYGHRVALEEEGSEFQDAPDGDMVRRDSEVSWHSAKTGLGASQAMARQNSHASSAGATSDTVTEVGSLSPELGRSSSPTAMRARSTTTTTPTRHTHSANTSQGTTSSVAMSRGDSSRTSESAASSRTALSRTSTGETSPRSSMSATPLPPHLDLTKPVELFHPALPSPATSLAALSLRTDTSSANLGSSTRSIGSPVSTMSAATTTSTSATSPPLKETPWFLQRDYDAREIAFNADGHVTGGTLTSLVERLTLHDTTIDTTFSNTFFLTFRLFATPLSLADTLFARFDVQPPSMTTSDGHVVELRPDELKLWHDRKLTPVRLRVYNSFKTWVESHWSHESDQPVVEPLLVFCKTKLAPTMSSAANRLVELIQKKVIAAGAGPSPVPLPISPVSPVHPVVAQHRGLTRMQSMERFRVGKLSSSSFAPAATVQQGSFGPPPPPPIVSKSLLSSLRYGHASVVDIDPLELARQLTLIESRLYCSIKPGELLGQEFAKKGPDQAVNVRAMSTLSTKLTGWISETILSEHDAKKRTALLKYFVKLGDRCLTLDNYNTLFAVLSALNSSTIARLRKTWDGLGTKYKTMLDQQRKATEHSRNYAEYRHKIRNAVPPCLPFVGLFLTDITMCIEGNPQSRPSPADPSLRLINFDRYQKMARIVGDLKRFQQPYNLAEVVELQQFLKTALDGLTHGGDAQSLYRQSLLVEPRDVAPSIVSQQTTKSDFFNWRG